MPLLGRAFAVFSGTAARKLAGMFLLSLLSVHELNAADSQAKLAREADLKAVFLFNFAQFVEWPRDAFASDRAPLVIGIVGESQIGPILNEIVANETVQNRPIQVRECKDLQEIAACQILFVGPAESTRLDRIFQLVKDKPILTVGETDDFLDHGGMIRFLVVQNRLRLKINMGSVNAARLTISSKLLRQAEIIGSQSGH